MISVCYGILTCKITKIFFNWHEFAINNLDFLQKCQEIAIIGCDFLTNVKFYYEFRTPEPCKVTTR